MKKFLIFFWMACLCTPLTVWGQSYQKAKQVLDGSVKIETLLKAFPDNRSDTVGELRTNQIVKIVGKQDQWFDVVAPQARGWVSTFYIEVLGVSKDQDLKVQKKPKANFKKVRNETDEAFFNRLRLVPYLSYALGGKNFYDQIRLGLYATLKTNDLFSVGITTEHVFINGRFSNIGPTFHRLIPVANPWINPSIQLSLLYYRFDHASDKDTGFGTQWVLENDFPLIERPKFAIKPVIRVGFDMVLFNVDEIKVPYFISAGASMHF